MSTLRANVHLYVKTYREWGIIERLSIFNSILMNELKQNRMIKTCRNIFCFHEFIFLIRNKGWVSFSEHSSLVSYQGYHYNNLYDLRKRYTPPVVKKSSHLKFQEKKKRFRRRFNILESFKFDYNRKVRARVRQHWENLRQLQGNQFTYWERPLTDSERELRQAVCITPRMTTRTTWQSSGRR